MGCGVDIGPSSERGPGRSWRHGENATTSPSGSSAELEALLGYPWPFVGRPPKRDPATWIVTDDWPEAVPITEAEIDVFERWFGDLFDDQLIPDT